MIFYILNYIQMEGHDFFLFELKPVNSFITWTKININWNKMLQNNFISRIFQTMKMFLMVLVKFKENHFNH